MTDPLTLRIWIYRAYYLALCLFILLWQILPLGFDEGSLPSPDMITGLTLAWLLRHPNVVPLGAIAIVFLISDFLTHAPVGLGALLIVLATESLRKRQPQIENMTFLSEFGTVTAVIVAVTLAERVLLTLLLADQPPFGEVILHAIVTIAAYPALVVISKYLLGLDRLSAADPDNV